MEQVSIITPLMRPENLLKMRLSIESAADGWAAHVCWYIVTGDEGLDRSCFWEWDENLPGMICVHILHGTDREGVSGNAKRNMALSEIGDAAGEWIAFLDDDNLLHPKLFQHLAELPEDCMGMTVWQVQGTSMDFRLQPSREKPRHIDSAQFILWRPLIGDTRWQLDRYDADGLFFAEVYEKDPTHIVYLERVAAYYNALR